MAYEKKLTRFNVHEAKTHLSKLLERVEGGEEIEIARNGDVLARLVPAVDMAARRRRAFGSWKGRGKFPDDFDDPLPDEILKAFYEGPIFPPGYDPRTPEKLD